MKRLRAFLTHRGGASAVEFAMIAPALGFMVVMAFDVWQAATSLSRMHAALDTSARYVMAGSADDTTARSIALSAWYNPPENAGVTVSRACKCGTAVTVCTGLCPTTQTPPAVYVSLHATGNGEGVFLTQTLSQTQVVRVR